MRMGLTVWLNGGGGHGIGDGGFGDHAVWGGGHGALNGRWGGLVHHHSGRCLIDQCIGMLNDHGRVGIAWRTDNDGHTIDGRGLHGFAGGDAGNVAGRWINNRGLAGAGDDSRINHHNWALINNNRGITGGWGSACTTIYHDCHICGVGGTTQ